MSDSLPNQELRQQIPSATVHDILIDVRNRDKGVSEAYDELVTLIEPFVDSYTSNKVAEAHTKPCASCLGEGKVWSSEARYRQNLSRDKDCISCKGAGVVSCIAPLTIDTSSRDKPKQDTDVIERKVEEGEL